MRVSVDVPDFKTDPLLKQLARQLEEVQRQLQGLKQSPASDFSAKLMTMMGHQQDTLMRAMERIVGQLGKGQDNDVLLVALRGLKKTLAGLPGDLKSAVVSSMRQHNGNSILRPHVMVEPKVSVNLNGLGRKLDTLQETLIATTRRSRSRTFGSNF